MAWQSKKKPQPFGAGRGAPNPYALETKRNIDAPPREVKKKTYTEAEQVEMLQGYTELPSRLWDTVRYGTQIRYHRKDGTFIPGGFVQQNPFDSKEGKRYMKLKPYFAKTAPTWVVLYEEIGKLYAKPDAMSRLAEEHLLEVVRGVNARNRKIKEHAERQGRRIAELERQVAALTNGRSLAGPPRALSDRRPIPSDRRPSFSGQR